MWIYDEQKFFIKTVMTTQDIENSTTVGFNVGYVKPKFNEELQEWFEGATEEEIKQWQEENKPVLEPNEVEILKSEIETLKESQQVQDFLIDDIVFEVIPSLEQQISLSVNDITKQYFLDNTKKILTRVTKSRGMASYLADKIIDGRDYSTVFKTNSYKQYQDEVNQILISKGKQDLIK